MPDELYVCSKQVIHQVYLSLGANIGNRKRTIRQAVELIGAQVGEVVRQSSLYETEPWGFSSPNKFINACVCCHTALTPHQVLVATQRIERELGRMSKSVDGEYHDRIIDIDILLYDDLVVDEPGLQIPHPHMHEREFVLRPLREIL
jgi:2-amino-4-hydroxy-6-hydroxymethyldihydropteridine pyrophosphokinase